MNEANLSVLFISALFFLSGCGVFETRTPQSPGQSRTDFVPPTSPDIVINNLKSSINDQNVDNYIACLSDTSFGGARFDYVPPVDVFGQYRSIFVDWNLNSERSYFNNLKVQSSSSESATLSLSAETMTFQGDSAIYNANYVLFWPHKVAGIPQEAQGNLQFFLGVDRNRNWSIYRWIDSRIGNNFTWSELKARFSGQ